jgi:rhodanese-related sulfurtransferase
MVGALSSRDLNGALIAGGFDAWAAAGKTVAKL